MLDRASFSFCRADAFHPGCEVTWPIRHWSLFMAARSARLIPGGGDGWIAAGDAALSFDPLSSQGLLTALYTGLRGGEAVTSALDGEPAKLAEYKVRLGEIWRRFLENRNYYYALETRWPDEPFWRRRGNAPSVSSAEMR